MYLEGPRPFFLTAKCVPDPFLCFASLQCLVADESVESPPMDSKHIKLATALSSESGSVVASDWIMCFSSINFDDAAIHRDIHDDEFSVDAAMIELEERRQ